VQLGSRERLLAFCEAVQRRSPVGSYTKPIAGTTPGYASEVGSDLPLQSPHKFIVF
ncbi:aluminum resistance protein, partial [Trifolium medium]|nr:aluminum resistance protein [Trifolium medium]